MEQLISGVFNFISLEMSLLGILLVIALLVISALAFIFDYAIRKEAYLTSGKILGYVEHLKKKKKKNGSLEEKLTRRLVYEYIDKNGELKRRQGNEWSSSYSERYSTGDEVEIRVMESSGDDSIFMADSNFLRYLGVISLLAGMAIVFTRTQSVKLVSVLLFLYALLFCIGVVVLKKARGSSGISQAESFPLTEILPLESLRHNNNNKNQ